MCVMHGVVCILELERVGMCVDMDMHLNEHEGYIT